MDSIHLLHYRNYTDKKFELNKHTLFVGPNGIGKTNVIEAIRTISVTKSYRISQDRDAIQWGEKYCRIELEINEKKFEYILTREEFGTKKIIKYDGIAIPLTQVYGLLPTVLFSPETMQLVDGPPQERRRFFDTLLSQASQSYIEALVLYRKVMRERHFILLRLQQGLGIEDELDFWDQELIRSGGILIHERQNFISSLNDLLKEIYPRFIDRKSKEQLQLKYKPSSSADDLAKRVLVTRSYDIKTATTNTGPHRDELVFLLDDRDVTLFASRGELRRSVLAVKLAEAQFLHRSKGEEPLLLLDDVFSELDEKRRASFLSAITPYRSVITTTDEEFIRAHPLEDAIVHKLK